MERIRGDKYVVEFSELVDRDLIPVSYFARVNISRFTDGGIGELVKFNSQFKGDSWEDFASKILDKKILLQKGDLIRSIQSSSLSYLTDYGESPVDIEEIFKFEKAYFKNAVAVYPEDSKVHW